MFAVVAAILFALALILDLGNVALGGTIETGTFVTAGLLCVALHLAGGAANPFRGGRWRRWRR